MEEEQRPQPVPAPAPPAPAPAPLPVNVEELFPTGQSEHKKAIVQIVLPRLCVLLKDPSKRLTDPRTLVGQCLDQCVHTNLWGAGGTFSRKRSVADSVLMHYFHRSQEYLAREHS